MAAETPDFVEAVCRTHRWLQDESNLMRALSEVRRRGGARAGMLYRSLRDPSKPDCAHADVATFRLELARIGGDLDAAARAERSTMERLRRFGASSQADVDDMHAQDHHRYARELSGLRAEVAASLPASLELANLDEIIRERCQADESGGQTCAPAALDSLAHLVKVRAKTLGSRHAEVARARLRYARMLLASGDGKQRALGEAQLEKILAAAPEGSLSRILATADLIVALRNRQATPEALVLEEAFVADVARPTSDRQVVLLGEAAATIATIAMAEHRDDDAHAVLQALMKAYAVSPLDRCGVETCDVRVAQIEMLERQATIQPVRAYEILQRIAEIQETIDATERVEARGFRRRTFR
jgi:hypothetical protein